MLAWLESAAATSDTPLLAAFLVGVLASVGPCPLATNVTALGYTARQFSSRQAVLASGLAYVVGRAAAYSLVGLLVLGAGATIAAVARPLQDVGEVVLGPILVLVGLVLLDVVRPATGLGGGQLASLQEKLALRQSGGAFLLGFAFALAFCPYSAALYFGVLIPLALGAHAGVLLPMLFGVGTAMPVLVLGLPLALGLGWAAAGFSAVARIEPIVRKLVGWLFVGVGLYLVGRLVPAFVA